MLGDNWALEKPPRTQFRVRGGLGLGAGSHPFGTDRARRARLGEPARAAASRLPGGAWFVLDAGIIFRKDGLTGYFQVTKIAEEMARA